MSGIRVLRSRHTLTSAAIFIIVALIASAAPTVSAQTQPVSVTPGYINLGMVTSVVVTAPSAASYSVVVQKPNGSESSLAFAPTAAGQVLNATYGNSTVGFKALVDQEGTYNVYLEQGAQVISAASFYATNKLDVRMDMVNGGVCEYIAGAYRGTKMFPRFYVTFASSGAEMTNLDKGASVNFTMPDGTVARAGWDGFAMEFVGKVQPNWNYTYIGPWNPTATAGDAAGNSATFTYTGSPYVISPVQLNTTLSVVDATTRQEVAGLYNGQTINVEATITYPTNPEPVPGFVAPLDSVTRGGSVTAQVGWGFYNMTSGTFGGKNPGGLLGTVLMTYTVNGTWTGQFESNSLPTLKAGTYYEVVVSSKDDASPANTGFAMSILPPATSATASTQTVISTVLSATTQSVVQTVQTIPTVVYAALVVLLILGLLIGYIMKVPR